MWPITLDSQVMRQGHLKGTYKILSPTVDEPTRRTETEALAKQISLLSPSRYFAISLALALYLSLSFSLSLSHTHPISLSHTTTLSLHPSPSGHISRALPLTHTHTHIHSFSHTHNLSLSISLSPSLSLWAAPSVVSRKAVRRDPSHLVGCRV